MKSASLAIAVFLALTTTHACEIEQVTQFSNIAPLVFRGLNNPATISLPIVCPNGRRAVATAYRRNAFIDLRDVTDPEGAFYLTSVQLMDENLQPFPPLDLYVQNMHASAGVSFVNHEDFYLYVWAQYRDTDADNVVRTYLYTLVLSSSTDFPSQLIQLQPTAMSVCGTGTTSTTSYTRYAGAIWPKSDQTLAALAALCKREVPPNTDWRVLTFNPFSETMPPPSELLNPSNAQALSSLYYRDAQFLSQSARLAISLAVGSSSGRVQVWKIDSNVGGSPPLLMGESQSQANFRFSSMAAARGGNYIVGVRDTSARAVFVVDLSDPGASPYPEPVELRGINDEAWAVNFQTVFSSLNGVYLSRRSSGERFAVSDNSGMVRFYRAPEYDFSQAEVECEHSIQTTPTPLFAFRTGALECFAAEDASLPKECYFFASPTSTSATGNIPVPVALVVYRVVYNDTDEPTTTMEPPSSTTGEESSTTGESPSPRNDAVDAQEVMSIITLILASVVSFMAIGFVAIRASMPSRSR